MIYKFLVFSTNILIVINVICLIMALIKKMKYFFIFFLCSLITLLLQTRVLSKFNENPLIWWLIWSFTWILMLFGVFSLIRGFKEFKSSKQ